MNQDFTEKDSSRVDSYTVYGQHDFLDAENNPRCKDNSQTKILARKIYRDDNSIRYSIKLDNRGKLYNPISIYGETKVSSFLDRICRSQNKYKDVNLKTFEMYIKFLKTKNIAWLNNAEREL